MTIEVKHVVNLTPHAIVLRNKAGETTFPASGQLARLVTRNEQGVVLLIGAFREDAHDEPVGFPVNTVNTLTDGIEGLPEPEEGTVFIVSSMVAQATDRRDVFAPDTGPTAVRENGQVVAVTRLQRFLSV